MKLKQFTYHLTGDERIGQNLERAADFENKAVAALTVADLVVLSEKINIPFPELCNALSVFLKSRTVAEMREDRTADCKKIIRTYQKQNSKFNK